MAFSLAADDHYTFTPDTETLIWYVSDSAGNNAWDGTQPSFVSGTTGPKKTLNNSVTFTLDAAATVNNNAVYAITVPSFGDKWVQVCGSIVSGTTLFCLDFDDFFSISSTGTMNKVSGTGPSALNWTARTRQTGAMGAAKDSAGGSARPDFVLLKRGDTFLGQTFAKFIIDGMPLGGLSATKPVVLGNYDSSILTTDSWGTYATVNPASSALARPIITSNGQGTPMMYNGGSSVSTDTASDRVATVGIKVSWDGSQMMSLTRPTRFLLFHDCYYDNGQIVAFNGNGLQFRKCYGIRAGAIGGGNNLETIVPTLFDDGEAYSSVWVDCAFTENSAQSGSVDVRGHTLYLTSEGSPAEARGTGKSGRHFVQNTIVARDYSSAVQFRPGGTYDNSTFIQCAGALLTGSERSDHDTHISNNVAIHMVNYPGSQSGTVLTSFNMYQGWDYGQGDCFWDKNLILHGDDTTFDPTTNAISFQHSSHNTTWTNNIVYKHASSFPSSAVVTIGGDGVVNGTVTGGSGYTDCAKKAITGFSTTSYGSTHIAKITVASDADWPWGAPSNSGIMPRYAPDHNATGFVYVNGFTGDFSVLNGRSFSATMDFGTNTITLGGAEVPGSSESSGAAFVYYPWVFRKLTAKAPSGGTTASADVIVAEGVVRHVHFPMSESDAFGAAFGESGSGFVNGDELEMSQTPLWVLSHSSGISSIVAGDTYSNGTNTYTVSSVSGVDDVGQRTITFNTGPALTGFGPTGTFTKVSSASGPTSFTYCALSYYVLPGAGTGFKVTSTELTTHTPQSSTNGVVDGSGNLIDPTGSYIDSHTATYPHPDRTVATYVDLIESTSGSTRQDFIDGAVANSRQNYKALYTAESLNDYLRQGMGYAMIGSAYADQFGGTTSTTPTNAKSFLMGQAIF